MFGGILGSIAGTILGSTPLGGILGGSSAGKAVTVAEVKKITSIGNKDGVPGVHIASLPCPKVTNTGLTASWVALDLLAKGAAVLATGRSMQAANRQNKIAREYYNLAKRQWDFYNQNYVPLEINEINELNKVKRFLPDYDKAIKGHDCAEPIFDSMRDHRDKLFEEHCICPDPSMAYSLELAMSTVRGDSHNFARRYAEFHADKLDDIRWNRKLQVASRGRGLLPQSSEFANKAAGLFGQYSQAMGGLAGQAMQFSGYIRNRRETVFNDTNSQRIETRWTPRANTQTGMNYGSSDVYSADGYRPEYYGSQMNTGNSFYTDAATSLGTNDILYDNTYSVTHGFGRESITGNIA